MVDLDRRKIVAAGQGVIHEARGECLAGSVVADLFEQHAADAERDGALDLSLHDRGVDEPAAVVAHPVAEQTDLHRLGIDLGERDVGAARIGNVGRLEEMRRLEPRRHAVRSGGHRGHGGDAP